MDLQVYEPQKPRDNKAVSLNKLLPRPVFRLILVGHSGSGKTNVMKNMLFNPNTGYGDYFDHIFLFSGSMDDLDEYQRLGSKAKCFMFCEEKQRYLKKCMKVADKMICEQATTNAELNELIEELEHNEFLKDKRSLFVFDDLITDTLLKNSSSMNAIDTLFVRGRHFGASVILSTQKYQALKNNLRCINATHVMLFNGIPNSNLRLISSELSGSYEEDEFIRIYQEQTRERYSFLLVNLKNTKDKYLQNKKFEYI